MQVQINASPVSIVCAHPIILYFWSALEKQEISGDRANSLEHTYISDVLWNLIVTLGHFGDLYFLWSTLEIAILLRALGKTGNC